MSDPDFSALRAVRNKAHADWAEKMRADGWEIAHTTHDDNACYCDCGRGGPCEHQWDGDPIDDGQTWSVTCSKCGESAYSHALRNSP